MLVICVLSAAVASLIYSWLRFKIEEWTSEPRMSRLSLKKGPRGRAGGTGASSGASNVIEISDDDSDSCPIYKDSKTDVLPPIAGEQMLLSDKDDANSELSDQTEDTPDKTKPGVFYLSTDSVESDEEAEDPAKHPSCQPPRKPVSVFSWLQRGKKAVRRMDRRKNNLDSGSVSEGSYSKAKQFKESDTEMMGDSKKENVPQVAIQHEVTIAGTKVKLPVKPYPCQIAVMNMLIKACAKGQNCLLESPTGSGKTLALLCGVLAWQEQYTAEIKSQKKVNAGTSPPDKCGPWEDDHKDVMEEWKPPKVPKVYYGTRTHKQIEQVIRELNKTTYNRKRMTILSSREHTCIQNSTKNKTELCYELLDPLRNLGCPFYAEHNKKTIATSTALAMYGLDTAWDIEDLVELGRDQEACPYFAARNLAQEADIIFCPYNYLIDPTIRESMQINLSNQVIVLDEAHNIEDTCRDAASSEFREDHLTGIQFECDSLAKHNIPYKDVYITIKQYIGELVNFLKLASVQKVDNSETLSSPCWTGTEIRELFNIYKIGAPNYESFLSAATKAIDDYVRARESVHGRPEKPEPCIAQGTKRTLEQLSLALKVIFSVESVNDYRGCIVEEVVRDFKRRAEDDSWTSTQKKEQRTRVLKLMCMNPAVIFAPLAESARSIILASGTLTPTGSFQSELGTQFPHLLSANHVISKDQVYVTCIPRGPNGVTLRANYQNVNTWSFQDELGQLLVDVCESVPHGVLCFFSSYQMMRTQIQRWRANSVWQRIERLKSVFLEPRYGGDLAQIMRDYRDAIGYTSNGPRGDLNGALLFAVFRGKVAEGIDFSDNEARCVLTVGIPYAVRKDPVVDMKIKYNDLNTSKGLLHGSEWYTIQAFRALNQALGRCLRHKNDWGAILLVDERIVQKQNLCYLPKWIKSMWIEQNVHRLKEDLRNFVARQVEREQKNSNVPST